jgi:hypothetical protein
MKRLSYFGYSEIIPVREVTRIDVSPSIAMKNRMTIITEEITQGIPVFTLSFFIIGRNTKESMKEKITGIRTSDMVLHRKPASTTARNKMR